MSIQPQSRPPHPDGLTHLNARGEAAMVDIAAKAPTARVARARGHLRMSAQTLRAILDGGVAKGDVLAVARVAGIQAAKRASDLIPLCHPLPLAQVAVDFSAEQAGAPDGRDGLLAIEATCKVRGSTGVEMEALAAVSVAALTVYDMCKARDRGMTIERIGLEEKTGGASGSWRRGGA